MGLFSVECVIENQQYRTRTVRVRDVLVDTGSELMWISQESLKIIGIETEKRDRRFVMANGETITRSIGFAILRVGDAVATDEVVFGETGDLQLLGARTLEGLNLRVDSGTGNWSPPVRSSLPATSSRATISDHSDVLQTVAPGLSGDRGRGVVHLRADRFFIVTGRFSPVFAAAEEPAVWAALPGEDAGLTARA